jgi:hypothetical protein
MSAALPVSLQQVSQGRILAHQKDKGLDSVSHGGPRVLPSSILGQVDRAVLSKSGMFLTVSEIPGSQPIEAFEFSA